MRTSLCAILLACLAFSGTDSSACTGIFASDGKTTLAGNNEDFWLCSTKMWFVPGEEGTYGRVYFGFEDMNPQGGMNEKGLFYDGFATQRCEVKSSLDRERYKGNIADDVMARCATVDEVIEIFSRYNLQFLENAMLFFGDANGDSVIIEGDTFVRKEGSHQVCTNFYQSITKPEDITCGRFKIATRMFEESAGISVDLFRRILAAVHIEVISPTQYSNVYDLKNRIVYLYHFHNYENVVKVDLMEELAKGAHTCDLPALFPETFAAKHFKIWREGDMEKKRAERRDAAVDPKTFDDYTGSYVVFEGVYAGATLYVSREGDTLFLEMTGMEKLELIPEGKDRFFQIGDYGSQDLAFTRNSGGKVTLLTYEIFMRKIQAKKVRSASKDETSGG